MTVLRSRQMPVWRTVATGLLATVRAGNIWRADSLAKVGTVRVTGTWREAGE